MTRPTTAAKHQHEDGGIEWRRQHQEAWRKGKTVPLPDFNESRPEHVTRDVHGGYLFDPTAGVVHTVAGSSPDCGLDSIDPAWFLHFWHEVQEQHPKAKLCGSCEWAEGKETDAVRSAPENEQQPEPPRKRRAPARRTAKR